MEKDVKELPAIDILVKSTGENTWVAMEEIMVAKIWKTNQYNKTCETPFNLQANSTVKNKIRS